MLETDRLTLRPWRVSDAGVQRELWAERDLWIPPHRRIDADGHPTVEDLEERIRNRDPEQPLQLLAAHRKAQGDVIGYCGLLENSYGPADEPEIAFEFLRAARGQGFGTEAALAILTWAHSLGYRRLWASVRDWNVPSRRLLANLGFLETDRVEPDAIYGDTLFASKQL